MLKMKNINNYFKKNISEEKRYYLTAINIFICLIYICSRFIYKVFIYMYQNFTNKNAKLALLNAGVLS